MQVEKHRLNPGQAGFQALQASVYHLPDRSRPVVCWDNRQHASICKLLVLRWGRDFRCSCSSVFSAFLRSDRASKLEVSK